MTSASVLYKTRRALNDFGEVFTSTIAGDNQTTIFELPEDKVDQVTVSTMPGDNSASPVVLGSTMYSLDNANGILTLPNPVAVGTLLVVNGKFYETWPDSDLTDYVAEAIALHTAARNPPVYLDPVAGSIPPTLVLPLIEERPVALLAASLVVNDQATDAAKDITIDTGDGTVIPRGQRYTQLVQEAARLEAEYQNLVEKLGIPGFDTVTVTSLRRVSMTTNRLVPEYVPREWDDRSFAKRVMPSISTGALAADAVITYRGIYNPTTPYNLNDLVDEGSVRYLCLTANTGQNPATDVAAGPDGMNGLYWKVSYINSGMAGGWGGGGW